MADRPPRLTGPRCTADLRLPLTAAGEAVAGARELAAQVARGAPLALAATKRVIVESADWDSGEAFARQGEVIGPVFVSADAMEGAAAFAERRAPAWRGE